METDDEDPQAKLEREIDELFEKTDKAAFYIMSQIVETVQDNYALQCELRQAHSIPLQ